MKPREYQQRAIDQLYAWMRENTGKNPCLEMPTGSGKSHIVALLCRDAVTNWPETKILMLTHVKELIEQNAEKMKQYWPNAPLGIYSASVGRKQIGEPITFGGIQSLRNKADLLGHIDLIIIDECFTGETNISTPNGEKRIDQMRCGDVVYNQCGYGIVEGISKKPVKSLYEVELSNGKKIRCTGNHPFFTESGWKKASTLENGESLFSIEDMRRLWESVQTLGKNGGGRGKVCNVRTKLEKSKFLLGKVCKEISSHYPGCEGKEKDKRQIKRDKTQTYKARRERAIATLTTACLASCSGRRVGGRACHTNEERAQKRRLSECLQGGYREQGKNDSNRAGRRESHLTDKKITRHQEGQPVGRVRVVSVSHIESESYEPVYNLQVSGHPSYFANGVAVHNCHLVSHKNEGGYRKLINDLKEINPSLVVIGLTATPYRLGHGYITDDPAIFDDIIKPVTIEELVEAGYLAELISKKTTFSINVDSVKKRGGEFIESDLQNSVDTEVNNATIIEETLERSEGREHWLVFCTGVAHAKKMCDLLNDRGVRSACLTGENTKAEREQIIKDFKSGKYRALTNANILTTGFDYPEIDLIIMARPTLSPALYVQMAGRGMRLKEGPNKDCFVFDFAQNIFRHGPITDVVPRKPGPKQDAPVKPCPECDSLLPISAKKCNHCGYEFPPGESHQSEVSMADDCIMGRRESRLDIYVDWWDWSVHTSRTSGKEMIKCSYYPDDLSGPVIREYLCITHEGFAGQKALAELSKIANSTGAMDVYKADNLQEVCDILNQTEAPTKVEYEKNGKFYNVKRRIWEDPQPVEVNEVMEVNEITTDKGEEESWLDTEPPF